MHISDNDFCAYLDNSLSDKAKSKLEQHLTGCRECSRKLNEWSSLYDTIGLLEFDFKLDDMEEKVLQRIRKEERRPALSRLWVLVSNMAYVLLFLFITSLFIRPVTDFAGRSVQYAANLLFNKSLGLFNEVKWYVVNIISFIQAEELTGWLFPLLAGITLIAGGSYLSFGKRMHKAA